MTEERKPYVTSTGRVLSDADIEALADEAEGPIDVEPLVARLRGHPPLPGGPAEVVPVRLDAALREALAERAASDATTVSEVIREALRRYLGVA